MKAAYIYTGQGFQYSGMLHELPDCISKYNIFQKVSELLHTDVLELDTETKLVNNENSQICIFVSELVWSEIVSNKIECQIVSGHSVGSFAAAVMAGTLSVEDAFLMVRKRGQMMEKFFSQGYGMMVVNGLTQNCSEELLDLFRKKTGNQRVYHATMNQSLQMVYSGWLEDLKAFKKFVQSVFPVEIRFIKVKVPSHCVLMRQITIELEKLADKFVWNDPSIPYMANTMAKRVWNAELIRQDLVTGAQYPVRWYEGISLMKEYGIENFVEVSSAETLCHIGSSEYPELNWTSAKKWLFL